MAIPYQFELGKIRVDRGEVIDKGNLVVDVRHPDFFEGARGDGIRDDGRSFNEAVKHLATQGGTILVPPGDYLLTTAFSFNSQDNIVLWLMPGVVLTGEALPTATGNNYILDWRSGAIQASLGSAFDGGTITTALHITATTQSTSVSTGALIVDGGVGIVKDVFIGGLLDVVTTVNVGGNLQAALVGAGGAPLAEFHAVKADDPVIALEASGESADEKVWVFTVDGTQFKGQTRKDNFNAGTTWLEVGRQSGSNVTDITVTGGAGSGITFAIGEVKTTGNFDATSVTSEYKIASRPFASTDAGATILYLGEASAFNTIEFARSDTSTQFLGTVSMDFTLTMVGEIVVNSVVDSTSTVTGSIQTDGGLGVVLDTFLGGVLNVAGATTLTGRTVHSLVTTFGDDATPTVAAGNLFITGGTTTITDFDNGVVGQTIKILSAHAITITDGSNILLNGSANFVMAAGDVLVLTMYNDQVWEEDSRKVNL